MSNPTNNPTTHHRDIPSPEPQYGMPSPTPIESLPDTVTAVEAAEALRIALRHVGPVGAGDRAVCGQLADDDFTATVVVASLVRRAWRQGVACGRAELAEEAPASYEASRRELAARYTARYRACRDVDAGICDGQSLLSVAIVTEAATCELVDDGDLAAVVRAVVDADLQAAADALDVAGARPEVGTRPLVEAHEATDAEPPDPIEDEDTDLVWCVVCGEEPAHADRGLCRSCWAGGVL